MSNWRGQFTNSTDRAYRDAFLREDANQVRSVILIIGIWVLGYIYADYLVLGTAGLFYVLAVTRIIFFCASVGLFFRLKKINNVVIHDFSILVWSLAMVCEAIFAATAQGGDIRERILVHSILSLGFYMFLPIRLSFRIIPAFLLTIIEIGVILFKGAEIQPSFMLTGSTTLIAMNLIGLISAMRMDNRRRTQYKIQETLISGQKLLKELARTDSLVNIPNRFSFLETAEVEFDRAQRYNHIFSFVMIDIDEFKFINDTYGHPFGDLCLQQFASILTSNKRSSDVVGRMAGDEFGMILPNTSIKDAQDLLERIRKACKEATISHPQADIKITFTAGISQFQAEDQSIEALYRRADQALYRGKLKGRDCIMPE